MAELQNNGIEAGHSPSRGSFAKSGRGTAVLEAPKDDDLHEDAEESVDPVERLLERANDYLKSFGDAPAWTISLVVHLMVFLALNSIVKQSLTEKANTIISTIEDQESQIAFDTVVVDQVGSNGDFDSLNTAQAMATVRGDNPQTEVEKRLQEEISPPSTLVLDEVEIPAASELVGSVNTKGALATENPGSTEGAIDLLAFEIASSLREHKMLVVWMFDASQSLKERRDSIANRFENVYDQLDALNVTGEKALKTAVVSYGQKMNLITPDPIDDIKSIIQPVRNLKNDESGKENVFGAVETVTKKWQPYCAQARRRMLVIIVTDEKGDDIDKLESAIQFTRNHGIRCYVVGNAAIFGKEKGYHTWNYGNGLTEDLPVDQGPETILPEALNLAFWGTNGVDQERMSAGYGPYALTRLCSESGGMYLIADESKGARATRFNHEVMRNYQPDYRPVREYQADLAKNKAKASLVEAAMKTAAEHVPIPQLNFRADTDTVLRQEITEAQKPAAELDYKLNAMQEILSKGEKDREKLKQPRWQASYDLAMGRVLAMRVRAFGYNTILAEMKGTPKPFQTKGSNHWRLVPSKEITSGPNVKKMALKATKYLKNVIDNHPDTPWAMLAERELSEPLGWDWKESHLELPNMGMEKDGKKALLLAEEKVKQEKERKMREQLKRPQL